MAHPHDVDALAELKSLEEGVIDFQQRMHSVSRTVMEELKARRSEGWGLRKRISELADENRRAESRVKQLQAANADLNRRLDAANVRIRQQNDGGRAERLEAERNSAVAKAQGLQEAYNNLSRALDASEAQVRKLQDTASYDKECVQEFKDLLATTETRHTRKEQASAAELRSCQTELQATRLELEAARTEVQATKMELQANKSCKAELLDLQERMQQITSAIQVQARPPKRPSETQTFQPPTSPKRFRHDSAASNETLQSRITSPSEPSLSIRGASTKLEARQSQSQSQTTPSLASRIQTPPASIGAISPTSPPPRVLVCHQCVRAGLVCDNSQPCTNCQSADTGKECVRSLCPAFRPGADRVCRLARCNKVHDEQGFKVTHEKLPKPQRWLR